MNLYTFRQFFILFFCLVSYLALSAQDNCLKTQATINQIIELGDSSFLVARSGYLNYKYVHQIIKYGEEMEPIWSLETPTKLDLNLSISKKVLFGANVLNGKSMDVSVIDMDGEIKTSNILLKKQNVWVKFVSEDKFNFLIIDPNTTYADGQEMIVKWVTINEDLEINERQLKLPSYTERHYQYFKRDFLYATAEYYFFSTSYIDYSENRKGDAKIILEQVDSDGNVKIINLKEFIPLKPQALGKWAKLGPRYRLIYNPNDSNIYFQVVDEDGKKCTIGALDKKFQIRWESRITFKIPITNFASNKFTSWLFISNGMSLGYVFRNSNTETNFWDYDMQNGVLLKEHVFENKVLGSGSSYSYMMACMNSCRTFNKEVLRIGNSYPQSKLMGYGTYYYSSKSFIYFKYSQFLCRFEIE